jgi:hypothetical protein
MTNEPTTDGETDGETDRAHVKHVDRDIRDNGLIDFRCAVERCPDVATAQVTADGRFYCREHADIARRPGRTLDDAPATESRESRDRYETLRALAEFERREPGALDGGTAGPVTRPEHDVSNRRGGPGGSDS